MGRRPTRSRSAMKKASRRSVLPASAETRFASLHQGRIEHVDVVVELREHRSLVEKTGQMPPIETRGFQPDAHLWDALRFGQRLHLFCEALCPRLTIGN